MSRINKRLFSPKGLVLFLFVSHLPLTFVNCVTLHVRNEKIIYFDESLKMKLTGAIKFCSDVNGHLPSVHSIEDIQELSEIVGFDTKIWLGAKPEVKLSYGNSLGAYKWTDETSFSYQNWAPGQPNCTSSCCGVSLVNGQMDTGRCFVSQNFVCVVRQITNSSFRYLMDALLVDKSTKVTFKGLDDSKNKFNASNNTSDEDRSYEKKFRSDLNVVLSLAVILTLIIFIQVITWPESEVK